MLRRSTGRTVQLSNTSSLSMPGVEIVCTSLTDWFLISGNMAVQLDLTPLKIGPCLSTCHHFISLENKIQLQKNKKRKLNYPNLGSCSNWEKSMILGQFACVPRGELMIFWTGVCHYKISISTLSGIFDEKVGPFSEFLCLMEVSKVRF